METTSPYSPPQTELLGEGEERYGQIKIFSAKGRIGRLRYIAYTLGITMLCYLAMGALAGLVSTVVAKEQAGLFLTDILIGGYVVMLVCVVLLTIQRSHDFNNSGWLSLILVVPLASFVFWFMPGTAGANRFGPPPPPNKGAAIVIVFVLVLLVILSILAAIAIPAYQEYVARAAAGG